MNSAGNQTITLNAIGQSVMHYGLVIILLWIGAMKFTAYEAAGISGLVANSPFMSWTYSIMTERQFSTALGIVEILVAILIAVKNYYPKVATIGAVAAIGMFLTTLSFMITTPGVFEPEAGGFPALSVVPGQFLIKDIALLGISIHLLADALNRSRITNL